MTDFPAQNLPYGVFSQRGGQPRVGVAYEDGVIDLAAALEDPVFDAPTLNPFMAQGRQRWTEVRRRLTALIGSRGAERHMVDRGEVELHLPFAVADYVDFYSSLEHASNLGRLFRPDAEPLLPNWRHLPVGYHGRSGTVVVSGTPIVRPCGQRRGDPEPVFGPSTRLDIETEVGFVVGAPSKRGTPLSTADFREHVFGAVLVNDWSARDIQAWEYVPLGPFLGKSFATSISPWVVPLDALEAARLQPPAQAPAPLPYLIDAEPWGFDIRLEVALNGHVVARPPFKGMYWTPAQQLAHMTVNGAGVRTGDLYASGTVSGPERGQRGSLIELSWGGADPIELPDGSTRVFLEDGDTVSIRATAPGLDGTIIGFGEVTGTVLAATPPRR